MQVSHDIQREATVEFYLSPQYNPLFRNDFVDFYVTSHDGTVKTRLTMDFTQFNYLLEFLQEFRRGVEKEYWPIKQRGVVYFDKESGYEWGVE